MLARILRDDPSIALATDQYELTMAAGYLEAGMAERDAEFHMFYRTNPFHGGFVIMAGLQTLLEALQEFRFARSDLDYLASLTDRKGNPLFKPEFLQYLAEMRLSCDMWAVPEGTVVFPNEPLVRVQGPLPQAQVLETLLLNILNFQSLVATKAARISLAAQGDPVIDFGLRRAQGLDGGFSASRAAYIGGCVGTSNVLAGKHLGIPVLGTHAHSWIMSFDTETDAFEAFARTMPDNCVFLVDTYDTIGGVRAAIDVALRMREQGHEIIGIRLDSGDLAYLSKRAREMLDAAGLPDAAIMASNELDEYLVRSLKNQGARINAWGVGTKLVTANDDPALNGVYKLAAVRERGDSTWEYKLKLSEQKAKISIPGLLQVFRYFDDEGHLAGDAIVDLAQDEAEVRRIIDPNDNTNMKRMEHCTHREPLLHKVVERGEVVYSSPTLQAVRQRAQEQLGQLDPGHKRFENPHIYPVGLSPQLNRLRDEMIRRAKGFNANNNGS